MAELRSAWRTGDSVAYETLRAVADERIAHSLSALPVDAAVPDEVTELRRRVLTVDGFDRAAVDELRTELERELS